MSFENLQSFKNLIQLIENKNKKWCALQMQHISKDTYLPSSTFPNLLHAILHYSFRRKRMKKSKTRLNYILTRSCFHFIFILHFTLEIKNSSLPFFQFCEASTQEMWFSETLDDFKVFVELRKKKWKVNEIMHGMRNVFWKTS